MGIALSGVFDSNKYLHIMSTDRDMHAQISTMPGNTCPIFVYQAKY